MTFDEWKLTSPYDLLPRYSVRCRVCEEFFDPDDCAEVDTFLMDDSRIAKGLCDQCAKCRVED